MDRIFDCFLQTLEQFLKPEITLHDLIYQYLGLTNMDIQIIVGASIYILVIGGILFAMRDLISQLPGYLKLGIAPFLFVMTIMPFAMEEFRGIIIASYLLMCVIVIKIMASISVVQIGTWAIKNKPTFIITFILAIIAAYFFNYFKISLLVFLLLAIPSAIQLWFFLQEIEYKFNFYPIFKIVIFILMFFGFAFDINVIEFGLLDSIWLTILLYPLKYFFPIALGIGFVKGIFEYK